MPRRSVGFSVGSVRAKETALFRREEAEQLLGLKGDGETVRFLREHGYGTAAEAYPDSDGLINAERDKLWDYALSVAARPELFDIFLEKRDFHNAKTVIKGVLGGKDYEHLLMRGTVGGGLTEKAVKERSFGILPDFLAAPSERAYALLAETGDPQLCDGILDRACYERRISSAARYKIAMLKSYTETEAAFVNIKIALRAAKTGKSERFLEDVIIPCARFPEKELIAAARSGEDEVLQLLASKDDLQGAAAADAYKKSPSAFEGFVDAALLNIARESDRITAGEEVLAGYVLKKEAELQTVRMIAVCVRSGGDRAGLLERLCYAYE